MRTGKITSREKLLSFSILEVGITNIMVARCVSIANWLCIDPEHCSKFMSEVLIYASQIFKSLIHIVSQVCITSDWGCAGMAPFFLIIWVHWLICFCHCG